VSSASVERDGDRPDVDTSKGVIIRVICG
jgi:hypothetical protein